MKRLLSLLLTLGVVLSSYAYDFQYNGLYYNITTPAGSSTRTCEVTKGSSDYTIKNLVVPEGVAYNGYRYIVTAIGESAFFNCLTLESVQLNASVKTIKRNAFANDVNIVSFSMPGVESLEYCSLGFMKGLKALEIPACAVDIDYEAMMCAQSLESITVDPANPLFMSDNGILYSKDKKVMRVFPGGRTGEYRVPDGVEEIAVCCFYGSNLSKISVPNSVKKIGGAAFRYCLKLESIDLGHGVEDMSGNYTFGSCPMLKQIVFPNSVKTIGSSFVNYCSNLEEVVFGESVEKIGYGYVSSTSDYINISSYENPTFPQNACFKNIVMLSKQIPDGYYYTPYGSSTPTAAFPRRPYGRKELPWKSNTADWLYSFDSSPTKGSWYEASSDYTGLFCKGDTLFAFYGDFKRSKPSSMDDYALLSDYKVNPDAEFYQHYGCVAFDFSRTGVDPKLFVGKKIPATELIGKTADNIDECGLAAFTIYTTPLVETAFPGDEYNINTYRVINFAQPADDGNGYPYYLVTPTVGERCRVTGIYNESKGGFYDADLDYTLKLRNKAGLTDGITYTLDGLYRKIGGEVVFEVMGQATTNSIAKQPTIEDLSVSLEHEDNNASYQWYALREQEGYEETLISSSYSNWYYDYGTWHTSPNTSSSYSDYTTSLRIPVKGEKGDILSFDYTYSDCTISASLYVNTISLSGGHVNYVLTNSVDSYLYISTTSSSYKKDAYAVISNLKLTHVEATEVPVRLDGATESHLSQGSFRDGDIVYCEVHLDSGEKLVSNRVQMPTNYIKKQPTYSDVSVALAIPDDGATYQWFRKRDVIQKVDDYTNKTDISSLCTSSGTYKWSLSRGVWRSGNAGVHSSSSTLTLTYNLQKDETLAFDCYVDSESGYDELSVTSSLGSSYRWTGSGSEKKSYTITTPGQQTWTFVYSKDSSDDGGLDRAEISSMYVIPKVDAIVNITEPIVGATSATFDKASEILKGDIIYCEVTLPYGRTMQSECLAFNSDITSVELNTAEATIGIGETLPLTANVLPSDAVKALDWTSSNPNVATVSPEGVVTGLATGTTIITATAAFGSTATASATITVYQPVESVTLSETAVTIARKNSVTLQATVLPETVSNPEVTWTSSDARVATVEDGVITAVGVGDAVITASVADGLQATCNVTVIAWEEALADGTPYINDETSELDALTFTKTFSSSAAGKWNAFYVPMSVNVEEYAGELDFAEIYAFCAMKDTNWDGVVDANDDNYLYVFPLTSGITKPNVPYLVRPSEAKTYVINSADNVLYAAAQGMVEFSTARDKFTVTGLYEPFTVVAGDNNYYVSSTGTLDYRTTGSTTVKANRWIMHRESKEYGGGSGNAAASSTYRIVAIGEDIDEATAIKLINAANEQGTTNVEVYSLDGRKVNAMRNLRTGVYIKNGQKIIVK